MQKIAIVHNAYGKTSGEEVVIDNLAALLVHPQAAEGTFVQSVRRRYGGRYVLSLVMLWVNNQNSIRFLYFYNQVGCRNGELEIGAYGVKSLVVSVFR